MTDRSGDAMQAVLSQALVGLMALGDRDSQIATLGWILTNAWGLLPWDSEEARSAGLDRFVAIVKQQLATADIMTGPPAGCA